MEQIDEFLESSLPEPLVSIQMYTAGPRFPRCTYKYSWFIYHCFRVSIDQTIFNGDKICLQPETVVLYGIREGLSPMDMLDNIPY